VRADYRLETGPVVEAIMRASDDCECDFLLMGGYGDNPVVEIVLGSSVDQVLRECYKPVLICR
jgi:nucleotide-binding universal stress UspA family protein